MKFDMGRTTLSTLVQGTTGSHEDLGGLVRQLAASSDQLTGKFAGSGAAAFAQFKSRSDEIADALNGSLARILEGQGGMDTAFQTGDAELSDNATSTQGRADFDGANFSSRR